MDPPKKPSKKELLVTYSEDVGALARAAAKVARGGKSPFFCQSRSRTEELAELMRRTGMSVFVHHSSVSREERELAEDRFHRGDNACIACTSTLKLGIDVGDLDRVLQAEAPSSVSSFLQRMGRTGRREGQAANTTFFCENAEGVLQKILQVVTGEVEYPYLNADSTEILANVQAELARHLEAGSGGVIVDETGIRWYTFAAGRGRQPRGNAGPHGGARGQVPHYCHFMPLLLACSR